MSLEHINPEGMLKSPAFSQGVIVPGNARLLVKHYFAASVIPLLTR
jgi:hypothetical protein